jgi:AcrR family transcriptional regulator
MATSRRTKASYHHGDLRQALVQAGLKALEKEGLAALSLRDVARRAGVSHNAPYRHFRDRKALLAALASHGFAALAREMEAYKGREMGEAYVRYALARPQLFRLMFGGALRFDAHPELRNHAHAAYAGLLRAFADLGADAQYAAAAAWSLVHGLSQLLLDGHFPAEDPESFSRRVLSSIRFAAQRKA